MEETKRRCVFVFEGQYVPDRGYVPSMVTENEAGHSPMVGSGELSEPWYWGHDLIKARQIAAEFNAKLGLSPADVDQVVASSIAAQNEREAALREIERKLGR